LKPIDEIIKDTEATHGVFADTATTAQLLKAVIRRGKNWEGLGAEGKEALEQTMTIVAHILTGNANEVQHWTGAAVYMRLQAMTLDQGAVQGIDAGMERIARRLKTIPNPPDGAAP
jgi:hypothetical protein